MSVEGCEGRWGGEHGRTKEVTYGTQDCHADLQVALDRGVARVNVGEHEPGVGVHVIVLIIDGTNVNLKKKKKRDRASGSGFVAREGGGLTGTVKVPIRASLKR